MRAEGQLIFTGWGGTGFIDECYSQLAFKLKCFGPYPGWEQKETIEESLDELRKTFHSEFDKEFNKFVALRGVNV